MRRTSPISIPSTLLTGRLVYDASTGFEVHDVVPDPVSTKVICNVIPVAVPGVPETTIGVPPSVEAIWNVPPATPVELTMKYVVTVSTLFENPVVS